MSFSKTFNLFTVILAVAAMSGSSFAAARTELPSLGNLYEIRQCTYGPASKTLDLFVTYQTLYHVFGDLDLSLYGPYEDENAGLIRYWPTSNDDEKRIPVSVKIGSDGADLSTVHLQSKASDGTTLALDLPREGEKAVLKIGEETFDIKCVKVAE